MVTKVWSLIDGKKAYILGGLTILTALVGKFMGPVDVGAMQIPAMDWSAAWDMIWKGCLVIVGKSAIAKTEPK